MTTCTTRRNGTVLVNGRPVGQVERHVDDSNHVAWHASSASGTDLGTFYAKRLAVHAVCLMGTAS